MLNQKSTVQFTGAAYVRTYCTGSWPGDRETKDAHSFKDVCKRDMKAVIMDTDNLEALATNRVKWKQVVSEAVRKGELSFQTAADDKRKKRKSRTSSLSQPQPAHIQPDPSAFQCQVCHRICKSRIGLHSHSRRCSSTTT